MEVTIEHYEEDQEFIAQLDEGEAELAYSLPKEGVMDIQHTYVSEELRGEGIAEQLAKTALEYAKSKQWKVIATCPFVSSYVKRHSKEYKSLLADPL
ncbi:N-acetyltransferase [Rhodocytophaga rosea]|uniref:N-acetyltransferase n=1 Tax=Rhodocytophaga rosea TaxID=2704465 RepID=A0A6C0GVY9_9BACT|nr:GNAT family N-acetyltransferase [Rhodocytophaga rosea]QHT71450.1 N-acetyltransferase [Rhodocytophaga rosea]